MCVIVELHTTFSLNYVQLFANYPPKKFHTPSSSDSLGIAINQTVDANFTRRVAIEERVEHRACNTRTT